MNFKSRHRSDLGVYILRQILFTRSEKYLAYIDNLTVYGSKIVPQEYSGEPKVVFFSIPNNDEGIFIGCVSVLIGLNLLSICAVICAFLHDTDKVSIKLLVVTILATADVITDIYLAIQLMDGIGCDYCDYKFPFHGIVLLSLSIIGHILFWIDFYFTCKYDDVNPAILIALCKIFIEDLGSIIIVIIVVDEIKHFTTFTVVSFVVSILNAFGNCPRKMVKLKKESMGCAACCAPLCMIIIGAPMIGRITTQTGCNTECKTACISETTLIICVGLVIEISVDCMLL